MSRTRTLAPRADLTRFREFHRLLPCDRDFQVDPVTRVPISPQARAHVGVLEEHRGDLDLVGYARTPWRLIRRKYRWLLANTGFCEPADFTVQLLDVAGVLRSLRPSYVGRTDALWNNAQNGASLKFQYADDNTAENEEQYRLAASTNMPEGAWAFDVPFSPPILREEAALRLTLSGSNPHPGAAGTIREIGMFPSWNDAGNAAAYFMVDRTVVTPEQPVNPGQIVTISYQWTFAPTT